MDAVRYLGINQRGNTLFLADELLATNGTIQVELAKIRVFRESPTAVLPCRNLAGQLILYK